MTEQMRVTVTFYNCTSIITSSLQVLCSYPVIPSFAHVCIYFERISPVAIFRTGFSFVEYCSGSFRPFLQSDY